MWSDRPVSERHWTSELDCSWELIAWIDGHGNPALNITWPLPRRRWIWGKLLSLILGEIITNMGRFVLWNSAQVVGAPCPQLATWEMHVYTDCPPCPHAPHAHPSYPLTCNALSAVEKLIAAAAQVWAHVCVQVWANCSCGPSMSTCMCTRMSKLQLRRAALK